MRFSNFKFGRWLAVLAFLAAVVFAAGDRPGKKVLRVSDGRVISFEDMIRDLKSANIVFIGEVHDSESDHRAELDVIRAVNTKGSHLALGLEMFEAGSQAGLDSWVRGELGLASFLELYYANWRFPWPYYRDIFLYARDRGIPMIGLNAPEEVVEKVLRSGFRSLTPEDLRKLPAGISCDVDKTYMEFIRKAYRAHELKEHLFENFCDAQMVWDKTMAWHLLRFMEKNPGVSVIVLAGAGHSWKRGIPMHVSRESKYTFRVLLPEEAGADKITIQDADYLLLKPR